MKDETKQKYIEKRMLIFKISFNLRLIWPYILSRLLDLFNINNKYAIVEREKIKDIVIEKNGIAKTYWNIDVKTPVYYFGNIYLYGYYPLQYVTKDLAWTYGREKELEELVNYAKKIVFMEGQHAKGIDTLEEIQELEAKKYKDKLGSFGAS